MGFGIESPEDWGFNEDCSDVSKVDKAQSRWELRRESGWRCRVEKFRESFVKFYKRARK